VEADEDKGGRRREETGRREGTLLAEGDSGGGEEPGINSAVLPRLGRGGCLPGQGRSASFAGGSPASGGKEAAAGASVRESEPKQGRPPVRRGISAQVSPEGIAVTPEFSGGG